MGESQVLEDWSQHLAPRESIPLDAFFAADEYIAKHHRLLNDDGVPLTKEDSNARDVEFKAIAQKHGVSEIDMLQALRHKMVDLQRDAHK